MNNAQPNPVDQVAVDFVETELARARASLRRTQLGAIVSVLAIVGYMSFVTVTLHKGLLQPKPAAQVMTHYVSSYVQERGTALSRQLIREIPAVVAHAPDYALAQLPVLRADIEVKLEKTLTDFDHEVTPKLTATLDEFLAQNQEQVHNLTGAARDPAKVHEFGALLEARALACLNAKGPEGASAMDRLAESAQALKLAEARLNRLAYATDLTPEEKQWRRVWGLILQQANRPQQKG